MSDVGASEGGVSGSDSGLPDFGRKYRDLAPELLDRVWREACAIERKPADALKRAKRALHQLHSAFVQERELAAAERAFTTEANERTLARAVLACHASTRERLATIEPLAAELRARLGTPRSVLDLGCGLHPFALPWLGLPRDAPYHARDVDRRMLALVERYFARLGQAGSVAAVDLVADDAPLPAADVALLFKLLPTLERQQPGRSARLLERLDVRAAVLSFPTRSLGARAKGMAAHYAAFCSGLLAAQRWRSTTFELGAELFCVVEKR